MDSCDNIRIGIICECEKGYDFGWLYSYYCWGYKNGLYGKEISSSMIFYIFEKSYDYELKKGTPVAFYSINDNKGKASNIVELSTLPFLYAQTDDADIKSANADNVPYWKISYKWRFDYCCIILPLLTKGLSIPKMYYRCLKGMEETIFKKLYALHLSQFKELSLEELSSQLLSFKNYVNDFSLEKVLNTYKCGKEGHFVCFPGRDDSFFYSTFKTIETDDEYIKTIIPLEIKTDYYNCVGRGENDNDYYILNEEEINSGKLIARQKYSKEEHFAFLVSHFFENYYSLKHDYEQCLSDIKSLKLSNRIILDTFGYSKYTKEYLLEKFEAINTKAISDILKEIDKHRLS